MCYCTAYADAVMAVGIDPFDIDLLDAGIHYRPLDVPSRQGHACYHHKSACRRHPN